MKVYRGPSVLKQVGRHQIPSSVEHYVTVIKFLREMDILTIDHHYEGFVYVNPTGLARDCP